MILWILQYLGAGLAILAQIQRSCNPKWIRLSFYASTLSAILLTIYFVLTSQYGLLIIEIVFIGTNFVGLVKWNKVKVSNKQYNSKQEEQ